MRRVLVVEDERTLADALEIAIGVEADLECVGAVGTVEEAVRILDERHPDVVLMDVHLPGVGGIAGTRRVRADHPDVRVVILTGDVSAASVSAATDAGAAGFLAKDSPFPDILAAIRAPADARFMVEGGTLGSLPREARRWQGPPADRPGLTPREIEVLELMGQGLDPAAIADRLVVSVHTARGHVKNIITKLQVHSQLEAVVLAIRTGLLPGPGTR